MSHLHYEQRRFVRLRGCLDFHGFWGVVPKIAAMLALDAVNDSPRAVMGPHHVPTFRA
jgi:hypothetical protein